MSNLSYRWILLAFAASIFLSFSALWIHDYILGLHPLPEDLHEGIGSMMTLLLQIKRFALFMEIIAAVLTGLAIGLLIVELHNRNRHYLTLSYSTPMSAV